MKNFSIFILFLLTLIATKNLQGQTVEQAPYYPMLNWDTSPYKSYKFTRPDKEWMNFRLLFPNGYDSSAVNSAEYPLIIVLHGGGESGRMEWNNSKKMNTPYPDGDPRRDNNDHHLLYGGKEHLEAVSKNRFPGFVLFPQNFYGIWVNGNGGAQTPMYQDLQKALDLLEYLVQELKVDPNRIYIHGLSKGAEGVWHAAYKRPDLFAAALPMSAPGDPQMAESLKTLPLWVFQGELDTSPTPAQTKLTVEAVRNAGGNVRYKEYENRGHNTWNLAYNEKDFYEWMLGNIKDDLPPPNIPPTVKAENDKTIMLPDNTTTLDATASDPDGEISSWLWTKVNGPEAIMENSRTKKLSLSGLQKGTYTFRITVTDNKGAKAADQVKVRVMERSDDENDDNETPENQAPIVDAGDDFTLSLPLEVYTLQGVAFDEDGEIASVLWEKISGPEVVMTGETTTSLTLTELTVGDYIFKFSATDNEGASASDEVRIMVRKNNNPPLSVQDDLEFDKSTHISLSAYPNPFTDKIQLSIIASQNQLYDFYILNAQGVVIKKVSIAGQSSGTMAYTIDTSGDAFEKGLYYMLATSKDGSFRKVLMMVKE